MAVKHVICTDQPQSKLEHVAGLFPWGFLGIMHAAVWKALPCPATSKKILNYPRCQLHPARWSGIFVFWFQTDPAKMARSHQLDVTHRKTMSLRSGSFEWLLSCKCVTVAFWRDLGGEDQSSLICGTGTLPLSNDSFPRRLGACCYLQPWKTQVPGTRGTWRKTPCHGLAPRRTFAGTPKARSAEDAVCYPGGSADTLPEPGWQELLRQMLAHISQQKRSRVVAIQERGRGTNKILKVRAWCAHEI